MEKFKSLPTRQPVAVDLWHHSYPDGNAFNTITTWHNKGKNIEWRDDTWYWTKDREFEKFLNVPQLRPNMRFELAAGVDDEVKKRLTERGWLQNNPISISQDLDRYRNYIQQSRGGLPLPGINMSARHWLV